MPVHNAVAGVVNVFCTAPFWRAQVLLMLQSKRKQSEAESSYVTGGGTAHREEEEMKGLLDAWRRIVAEDGVGGLYKGVGPSLWLVSNPIIQFVVYEELINALKRWQGNGELSSLMYFVCGAVGKACATVATYPLQVMQTQLRRKDSPFKDMKDCVQRFAIPKIAEGDPMALYSGLLAKLWQTVSNSAIKFMIYEKVLVAIVVALRWTRKVLVALLFAKFVSKTNGVQTKAANL